MQNPNKSSTNKNKHPSMVSRVLVSLVLILFVVGSGFFFGGIWQEKAFNIDSKPSQTKTEVQNGNKVVIHNYTFIVENYVPLRDFTAYPTLLIYNSTYDIIEQLNYTEQGRKLAKLGVKIDSWEKRVSYADKELYRPRIEVDPTYFPVLLTEGMSKTTLIINWRYNITETVARANLLYSYDPDPAIRRVTRESFMSMEILRTLERAVLPYLFFVASGFMFSFYAFQSGKLMNDYGILSRFPKAYEKAGASEKKEMEKSLGRIADFPKEVGRGWRLLFGMSIFVVRALVNDRCKYHDESIESNKKIATFRRSSLSKIFSKGKKSAFEKIEDTLPELKTIGIVAAALSAVGVSFSFNVGAAAPFLYSLALFYFFFNLGSIFQFVIKSYKDRYWTIAAIILAVVAVLLPEIIDILRLAT